MVGVPEDLEGAKREDSGSFGGKPGSPEEADRELNLRTLEVPTVSPGALRKSETIPRALAVQHCRRGGRP